MKNSPLSSLLRSVIIFIIIAFAISLFRNELIIRELPDKLKESARIGAMLSSIMTLVVTVFLISITCLSTWYFLQIHNLKIDSGHFISCITILFIAFIASELTKGFAIVIVFVDEVQNLSSDFEKIDLTKTSFYKIAMGLDILFVIIGLALFAEKLIKDFRYPVKDSIITVSYFTSTVTFILFLLNI